MQSENLVPVPNGSRSSSNWNASRGQRAGSSCHISQKCRSQRQPRRSSIVANPSTTRTLSLAISQAIVTQQQPRLILLIASPVQPLTTPHSCACHMQWLLISGCSSSSARAQPGILTRNSNADTCLLIVPLARAIVLTQLGVPRVGRRVANSRLILLTPLPVSPLLPLSRISSLSICLCALKFSPAFHVTHFPHHFHVEECLITKR